jgi:allantoate deiminase
VIGFVELHIEQGPVLEAEGIPVAVVEGITGQTRLNLRFTGQANHAGTTPMHLRRDALAAAAEWVAKVEKQIRAAATTTDPGIVATVGRIVVEPNAGNVIAGSAEVSFEIRYGSSAARHRWTRKLIADAEAIAKMRGIGFEWTEKLDQQTVRMDRGLSTMLRSAVKACGEDDAERRGARCDGDGRARADGDAVFAQPRRDQPSSDGERARSGR